MQTFIIDIDNNDPYGVDDGEECDGCGEAGAMCEADGFVFHNGECWAAAEQRYYRTKSGARTWLRNRLQAAWDNAFYVAP